jgi:hypothetical protein
MGVEIDYDDNMWLNVGMDEVQIRQIVVALEGPQVA